MDNADKSEKEEVFEVGDGDNDNECRGNLKCGDLVEDRNNNCKKHFNSIWNSEADCCYDPNTLGN